MPNPRDLKSENIGSMSGEPLGSTPQRREYLSVLM